MKQLIQFTGFITIIGVFLVGGVSEVAGDDNDPAPPGSIISSIESDGHYAMFASDPALWLRSNEPLDVSKGGMRWIAEPVSGGSLRCRVEDDNPPGNVGGYINIGDIGNIKSITVESEAVTDGAMLWLGFFFDVSETGDFWEWEGIDDNTDRFVSLGEDPECLNAFPAGEDVVLTRDTEWDLFIVPYDELPDEAKIADDPDNPEPDEWVLVPDPHGGFMVAPENYTVTLEDFAAGTFAGDGYEIDLHTSASTNVGLGLAVFATGGTNEVIIENVTVEFE